MGILNLGIQRWRGLRGIFGKCVDRGLTIVAQLAGVPVFKPGN